MVLGANLTEQNPWAPGAQTVGRLRPGCTWRNGRAPALQVASGALVSRPGLTHVTTNFLAENSTCALNVPEARSQVSFHWAEMVWAGPRSCRRHQGTVRPRLFQLLGVPCISRPWSRGLLLSHHIPCRLPPVRTRSHLGRTWVISPSQGP